MIFAADPYECHRFTVNKNIYITDNYSLFISLLTNVEHVESVYQKTEY